MHGGVERDGLGLRRLVVGLLLLDGGKRPNKEQSKGGNTSGGANPQGVLADAAVGRNDEGRLYLLVLGLDDLAQGEAG